MRTRDGIAAGVTICFDAAPRVTKPCPIRHDVPSRWRKRCAARPRDKNHDQKPKESLAGRCSEPDRDWFPVAARATRCGRGPAALRSGRRRKFILATVPERNQRRAAENAEQRRERLNLAFHEFSPEENQPDDDGGTISANKTAPTVLTLPEVALLLRSSGWQKNWGLRSRRIKPSRPSPNNAPRVRPGAPGSPECESAFPRDRAAYR